MEPVNNSTNAGVLGCSNEVGEFCSRPNSCVIWQLLHVMIFTTQR